MDPTVFKSYTKTLLHAKSAMRSMKVRQELFKDLEYGSRDEININSEASLLQPTNLTRHMVEDYLNVHRVRLFELKDEKQIEEQLLKMSTLGESLSIE